MYECGVCECFCVCVRGPKTLIGFSNNDSAMLIH